MNLVEAMGQTSTPKKSEETTTVPQQVRQTSESETEIEDTSERPSIEDAMRRIQQESSDSTTKTEENTEDNRTE